MRDRVAQIVARFDDVPRLHGEVGTKELFSYVNLPCKGALPFSAGCSKQVIQGLLDADPVGMELARIEIPDIQYSRDPYECANGADALVIVTEWEQFRALDLDRLKREMVCPVVVDLRNVYDPRELTRRGFLYQSIGRAN